MLSCPLCGTVYFIRFSQRISAEQAHHRRFHTVVLERTLESPWVSKATKPVHPEGNQSWLFFGRTDAETPILCPPDVKRWLIGKDPDAGKDRGQEEKGTTEGEMAGWHHRLDGHEFGQAPGDGDGQGGLACCRHGVAESDTTERLNKKKLWRAVSVTEGRPVLLEI